MIDAIADYFAALRRLKERKAKINNDTVAIEAGRKKGSIKKSRPQFDKLIAAIALANQDVIEPALANLSGLSTVSLDGQEKLVQDDGCRLNNQSGDTKPARTIPATTTEKTQQSQLDAALARELSLLVEVFELRKELAKLRGGKVIPIREHVI